jgi:uncharacterized surface protein with fasciclin (FAS1) repeats
MTTVTKMLALAATVAAAGVAFTSTSVLAGDCGSKKTDSSVAKAEGSCGSGGCESTASTVLAMHDHKAAKDIVDTAVAAGSFKTLAAALQAAGLVETLKGAGPFTVFAPTDEAFAKLPAGTVESLLKPEAKEKLTGILTYHVVSGNVKAADVVKLSSAKTVNGKEVTIAVKDGKVHLNGNVTVTKTDIETSNGTIHVIDGVLLPM